MKLKLEPKSLGQVNILLRMEDGKLRGSITVENDKIREIFGERMVELVGSLTAKTSPLKI